MHSSGSNMKTTSYNNANEVVDELFESLDLRHQGNLETSMRKSNWFFIQLNLLNLLQTS